MYRFFLAMAIAANASVVGLHLGHLIEPGPHWAPHWSRVFLGIFVTFVLSLYIVFDDRPLR